MVGMSSERLITLAGLVLAACASHPRAAVEPVPVPGRSTVAALVEPVPDPPRPEIPPWSALEQVHSNAGSFRIYYRLAPASIPSNEPFALEAWVVEPEDERRLLADARLIVDAAMPEHGHGMNREPRTERRADGGYDVSGLLFHMPGRWELYFDVVRGAKTERAQLTVNLE
jgi:hypothetical protein